MLDTQNQFWANDKSKFGYKMLQKMGWSEGKGLGANEDGATESIKVRKKTSVAGIGAKATALDAWKVPAQVATGLNDVLSRLASSANPSADTTQHAPISNKKEARGYYQRRAARKNVQNYSQDALKEIFGGVAPTLPPITAPVDVKEITAQEKQEKLDRRERKRLRREKREKKKAGDKSKIKKKRKQKHVK